MSSTAPPPTVLLAARFAEPLLASLGTRHSLIGPLPGPPRTALLELPSSVAASVRALVTVGSMATDAATFTRLPALGLVCCIGSGYEGVDLHAAASRGIAVTHSPGANAASVADVALGLLLGSIRRLPAGDTRVRNGDWARHDTPAPLVRGLTGRRVGIYGLGAIGLRIARRVVACEALVGYHNRRPRTDVPYDYFPSLAALAHWADALIVAVRADASNRHAVDAAVLRALGPDGHVVNISRGFVIDEEALIVALSDGTLAGAGLDVFEHEPEVPQALRELPNVALAPHVGGGTLEAQAAMGAMVRRNLDAFFDNDALPNPVPETSPPAQALDGARPAGA